MIEINSAEVEMLVKTITGDLLYSIHDGTYPAETYWMFKTDVAMLDAWFAKIYQFGMSKQIPYASIPFTNLVDVSTEWLFQYMANLAADLGDFEEVQEPIFNIINKIHSMWSVYDKYSWTGS
ncbi:hypothetical protein fnug_319 [Pseudomonas phage fnug]|uniref:Uncharacterized protein n=2 Tax=Phikzvirus phiKZ TaxID=169683 RepID=A0A192Y7Y8_9CAUD|nr:hypothetical protein KTN4_328 [Pseudomonas phage KTN4]QJB22962.1 hypothetical protein fnug_319 [Pseudomonas phage fnug]UXD83300.1 hypothetical protein NP274_00248 [Pseudomonas phage Koomba boorn-mokiny kep-wari Wadjak 1]